MQATDAMPKDAKSMLVLLDFNALIVHLFVGVKVHFALVAVVGNFVVHPIGDGGRNQRLVVLQGLARLHNECILGGQLKVVGNINMAVEVVHDGSSGPLDKLDIAHFDLSSLLGFNADRQRLGPFIEFRARSVATLTVVAVV